jgi:hypothetical protein
MWMQELETLIYNVYKTTLNILGSLDFTLVKPNFFILLLPIYVDLIHIYLHLVSTMVSKGETGLVLGEVDLSIAPSIRERPN